MHSNIYELWKPETIYDLKRKEYEASLYSQVIQYPSLPSTANLQ